MEDKNEQIQGIFRIYDSAYLWLGIAFAHLYESITTNIALAFTPFPCCKASQGSRGWTQRVRFRVLFCCCSGVSRSGVEYFELILFSYYCKYGVLGFGDDRTGPADESKRTKRVQGWSRQIMGGGFFIICNTITL